MRRLATFLACLLGALTFMIAPSARAGDAELEIMLRDWLVAHNQMQKPEPCTTHCYLLSTLMLTGAVGDPLHFEMHGGVLVDEEVHVPLFGMPQHVRIDDLTINGAPATVGFEGESFYVLTRARSFVLRGTLTLLEDEGLKVVGPVNSLDVKLTRGRVTEGSSMSGVENVMLHFDPMTPESLSKAKVKSVFRLSRALRIGKEKTFNYRLTLSGSDELGTVTIPLRYGEHVREVSGSEGWSQDASEVRLPLSGHDADVTITGVFDKLTSLRTDERSAYEWLLVEGEPDTLLSFDGDVKQVDLAQSPIPATLPSARLFLVQRGQHLDVDQQSLLQGEQLSAVVRDERHFFAFTPLGEVIHDGTYVYDNNGLERLFVTPAGKPMFVSVDGSPTRVLRASGHGSDFLVQLPTGPHRFRVQTLSADKIRMFGGMLSPELPSHALATSRASVTMGLPDNVLPLFLFGGDKTRSAFSVADLVAVLLGSAAAAMGFRTRRTRILGAVVLSGLWLVSHSFFVVAAATLFCVGGVFVASRFLRGNWLVVASGACVVMSLIGGKIAIGVANAEYAREIFVAEATPSQEQSFTPPREGPDGKPLIVPVQLSIPISETYVGTSRQLVSAERPFRPRLVYLTTTTLNVIQVGWLGLCAWLLLLHRVALTGLVTRALERLRKRPEQLTRDPRHDSPF
jgi:hypothetical protein